MLPKMLGMNSKDKGVWGQFDYQRTVAQIAKKFGLWKPPLLWVKEQKQQLLSSAESNEYGKLGQRSKAPFWMSWMVQLPTKMEPPPHPPEAGLWGTSPSGSPVPPTYSWKQTDFRFPASNLNPVSKQLQVYIEWTAQPGVSTAGTNTQE